MQTLGHLKRVEPRSVWQHEARDLTPWLRDNIEILAEAVGLELDLAESESQVGDYFVDLCARDLSTGRPVIIENQLEPTDHNHLGQLMAYAAGKEASVVIWISPRIRDEHRRTLDWLNEITGEEISFFGIELQLFQIDDSLPAPHFSLVAQPNQWQKAVAAASGGRTSERQQAYEAFFTDVLERAKKECPGLTKARRAYPQSWLTFPTGRSGFSIAAAFGQQGIFRVELYIDVGVKNQNKAAFDSLHEDKGSIEQQIGREVIWQRLDDRRASRIYSAVPGAIDDEAAHLEHLKGWAVETVALYRQVFGPRVQQLVL
ncbi:MAG: DUF4268 domain-containing protein [Anaerolineae bacterium]|nr:DUF4268 domain-containing protein [Anaerolineae bacterium]